MKEYELLLAELMLKVAAMEKILVSNGIITSDQMTNEMKKISEDVISKMKDIYGKENN